MKYMKRAKSLVFSITATLDWSRITWPPRASWLRQGALKFIIVASRFVDGSDKRHRSKFNFEEKKDGIINCLNQIKQWNFSGKWLYLDTTKKLKQDGFSIKKNSKAPKHL